MNRHPIALLTLTLGLITPTALLADERPRWMSPEAGWVDEETDTRVENVTRDEKGGYRVEISIPELEKPIEEVVVVGVRDEGPDYELPIRYEVMNDIQESGRRGIILYMGSDDPFALRINYDDGAPQKAKPRDPGLIKR